ncbi:uncharacterized protein LOC107223204 [Neodiprion lecontei]|uniref:Uncharacterized protein LOC107223204 n=1 Tax=Neodiprion lecontei TaxID=441921 RepID=A0A6J0BW68_NEOLC|nr:uncharacterized protein LOC107223204 [Neodiprion lecontei]
MFTLLFLYFSTSKVDRALCTIDINLSELEYLAGHLDPSECRRLVAALHYNSFELPENISGAERKVNDDIPCLRQLLHWNSSPGEGRGQTHEDVEHRLRQLKHNDLADWLGKTTFKQLRNDLDRALRNPFSDLESEDTVDIRVGSNDSTSGETTESTDQPPEEDPWLPVDTLMFATLSLSLTALAVICVLLVFHHVRLSLEQRNNNR